MFLEENVRTQLKTSHTSDITYVICLPTEYQGVHKDSLRNIRALQNRNETGKCWFLRRGKHRSTLKKLFRCAITAPLHCAKNTHLSSNIFFNVSRQQLSATTNFLTVKVISSNRAIFVKQIPLLNINVKRAAVSVEVR